MSVNISQSVHEYLYNQSKVSENKQNYLDWSIVLEKRALLKQLKLGFLHLGFSNAL